MATTTAIPVMITSSSLPGAKTPTTAITTTKAMTKPASESLTTKRTLSDDDTNWPLWFPSLYDELSWEMGPVLAPWRALNRLASHELDLLSNLSPFTIHSARCDILEKPDHFEVTADIPGFNKEDVKVEIKDDVLTISAEHSEEKKMERKRGSHGAKFIRVERRTGSLNRQIKLPPSANLAAVEAKADNGVLTVTIGKKPVSPADMPKSIPVAIMHFVSKLQKDPKARWADRHENMRPILIPHPRNTITIDPALSLEHAEIVVGVSNQEMGSAESVPKSFTTDDTMETMFDFVMYPRFFNDFSTPRRSHHGFLTDDEIARETGLMTGFNPTSPFTAKCNLIEKPDHYEITADVPGFQKDEVHVKIKHNLLAINADHSEESRSKRRHDLKHAQPLRIERRYGALHREIHLPPNADLEVITAKCDHGVLTVTVGKKTVADPVPEGGPRRIRIA